MNKFVPRTGPSGLINGKINCCTLTAVLYIETDIVVDIIK